MTRTELVKSLEADLGKQLGSNYGYDWCAAYVSDKLLKPIGEKWFSSCTQMRDYFNQKGRVNHDYRTAEVGDIIELTDIQNVTLKYKVFKKYVIDPNDISVILPEEENAREVTLITCTNGNKNRLVIKARQDSIWFLEVKNERKNKY